MKILIFGTGLFYRNRRDSISKEVEIVGFLDNDAGIWGTMIDDHLVHSPNDVVTLDYDVIVLCSLSVSEMRAQLLSIGVEREKIWDWYKFCSITNQEDYCVYGEIPPKAEMGKNVLIITQCLGYGGGSLASVYAAMALRSRGFSVVLAAPAGDSKLIGEVVKIGIPVVISSKFYHIQNSDIDKMRRFDIVIPNIFSMLQCACEISKEKPVLWWVHENSARYDNTYPTTRELYPEYDSLDAMKDTRVVAVSKRAQMNFNEYYPGKIKSTMVYGIPDMWTSNESGKRKDKLVFAIIGNLSVRKAQHIFVDAVRALDKQEIQKAEFWIIGASGSKAHYCTIKSAADEITSIKILGQMTREEIDAAYREIDVVVCASLEETMSIVVTEGMMYGKLCITTDATGMADYIVDGENGFICKVGDATDLSEKISYIIRNNEKLDHIRKASRNTYEKNFTMEKFGERLERQVEETLAFAKGNMQ